LTFSAQVESFELTAEEKVHKTCSKMVSFMMMLLNVRRWIAGRGLPHHGIKQGKE
jgi:hypothetical protein